MNSFNKTTAFILIAISSISLFSCKKENYSCTYIVTENGLKYTVTVDLEKRTSKDIKEYTDVGYTCTVK